MNTPNHSAIACCLGSRLPNELLPYLCTGFRLIIGRDEGITILGGLPNFTNQKVLLARTAPITLGLHAEGDALFLVADIEGLETGDMPYDHSVPPPSRRGLPDRSETEGFLITLIMADSTSGTVVALRAFTVTPAFSALIEKEFQRLDGRVGSRDWHHRADVSRAYRKLPTPRHMLAKASHREIAGKSFPTK